MQLQLLLVLLARKGVTLLGWTISLATTDLNAVRSPEVTKSDFYIGFSVQNVFGTQDRFRYRKKFLDFQQPAACWKYYLTPYFSI